MHNIKDIRQNPDFYKDKLMERNYNLDLDGLIKLDKKNRELIRSLHLANLIKYNL